MHSLSTQVDALLCLSTTELDLKAGLVSRQILQKAGDGVQKECSKVAIVLSLECV